VYPFFDSNAGKWGFYIYFMESLQRYQSIIPDWKAFSDALWRPLPITGLVNVARISVSNFLELYAIEGIEGSALQGNLECGFKLSNILKPSLGWQYKAGLFHLMEEVSMIPVQLLDPQPGERILDLCAAPGSKTLMIALAMKNRGTLIANEFNRGRIAIVRSHLERMGMLSVSTFHHNGTNLNAQVGRFDRILCDVPCSCEATHRKHGKAIAWGHPDFRTRLTSTQRALLRKALQLCKVGGRIVYSTCTYAPEENECVLDAILREYPGVVELRPARVAGWNHSEGLRTWEGQAFVDGMEQCMRVYPHQNDTGGFFVAVLEKRMNLPAWESCPESVPPVMAIDKADPELQSTLQGIQARFGISESAMPAMDFFQKCGDLFAVSPEHLAPPELVPMSCGTMFMRATVNYPKMPTGMANILAPLATRNVVDLDAPQREAFLRREHSILTDKQCEHCELDGGFVFVRFQGYGLGQGRLHPGPEGTRLQSLFPKGWALDA